MQYFLFIPFLLFLITPVNDCLADPFPSSNQAVVNQEKKEKKTAPPSSNPSSKLKAKTKELKEPTTSSFLKSKAPSPSLLSQIVESQLLRICVRTDTPPFGFFQKRMLSGFDIELAQEVTTYISIQHNRSIHIQWMVVQASKRLSSIKKGHCDLAIATLSRTQKRMQKIAFSKIYLQTQKSLIKKKGKHPKEPIVGVVQGTTYLPSLPQNAMVSSFSNYIELQNAMQHKLIDFALADQPIALYLVKKNHSSYQIAKKLTQKEEYGIGLHKKNKKLLKLINQALTHLRKHGKLKFLKQKWLLKKE